MNTNTFEGGTDAANVSTSNSGADSGDAIDLLVIDGAVVNGGNTDVIYAAAAASNGTLGCRMTLQASTTYARWDTAGGELRHSVRRAWKHQVPSAQAVIASVYDASQSRLGLTVESDGKPALTINNNGTTITAAKPPTALTVGQWYYLEGIVQLEDAGADGAVGLYIWDSAGNLVHSYTDTGLSLGSSSIAAYRLGTLSTSSGLAYDYLDEVACGPLASGVTGPPAGEPVAASAFVRWRWDGSEWG